MFFDAEKIIFLDVIFFSLLQEIYFLAQDYYFLCSKKKILATRKRKILRKGKISVFSLYQEKNYCHKK